MDMITQNTLTEMTEAIVREVRPAMVERNKGRQ
jgi:hypothetical protein